MTAQALKPLTREGKIMAFPESIRPEELAERYADRYTIYRESHTDGTGSRWVAKPHHAADDSPEKITANDIEELAEKLAGS